MRRAALAFAFGLSVLPACAQTRTPEYGNAESTFNENYDPRSRVIAQVLLIATGHQNSVPTERFSLRTYNALKRFEAESGLFPDGVLTKAVENRLFAAASPMLNQWDFKSVSHPWRGRSIWMPQGMGLRQVANKNGLMFRDPQNRITASYNAFDNVSIDAAYQAVLEGLNRDGSMVHYSVIKEGWFVISATSRDGVDQYKRYHQDGNGILGFALIWNNNNGNLNAERIAILMSASLGSVMNGRPMIEPPGLSLQAAAASPAPQPAARVEPPISNPPISTVPVAPVPLVAPRAEEKGITTGTGFFVDGAGHLVTNAHVIADCKVVIVKLNDGKPVHKARIIATDSNNDLALLDVEDVNGGKFAALRLGTRLGEGVAVFGYPHADVLASSGNFTLGNVTALAGVSDDSRYYQVSAPVQQGNSGGPLLDTYGNAVGVVAAKLNVIKMAAASGDFAQNINFAIKSTILATFLDSNQIPIQAGSTTGAKLDPADLADAAKAMSGFVACQ